MSKDKIVVANWKMNPVTTKEALSMFAFTSYLSRKYKTKIVLCSPQIFISVFPKKRSKNLFLGVQDISYREGGAFTGEIGPSVLKPLGINFAIVGHSERRAMGETKEMIVEKMKIAIKNNITPIVCFGEKQRDGEGHFFHLLKDEVTFLFKSVSKEQIKKVIIAYEPVWAIGSKSNGAMKPQDLLETVLFIRKVLSDKFGLAIASKIKILYGGSVDKKNARDILSIGKCDGLLVGRASLLKENFEGILSNFL